MADESGRLDMDFDRMNEADVREIIVRPLLHRLGFRHGTDANIRTEVTLRYGKAFLGRKKPGKDPDLIGRADYICEVVSVGRWVVEVKSPSEPLGVDAIQQAHTYAAHPEIGAAYFLLTNGRRFALYQTGQLEQPALEWSYEETEANRLSLFNTVGPDAIRKRHHLMAIDTGQPLGPGVASEVSITGGLITYRDHASDTPLVPREMIEGLQLPVTGGFVRRAEDGRIHARVEVASGAAIMQHLQAIGATDAYDFYSAAAHISTDATAPTIFQNLYESSTPAGKLMPVPGIGHIPLPFGFQLNAYTQAVGFVEGGLFRGVLTIEYDLEVVGLSPMLRPLIEARFGKIPDRSKFSGDGEFEVRFI